jgi:hypothetical protein
MKFMRTAGCTHLVCKKNLDIMKELNTQAVMEFIENYRSNCKNNAFLLPLSRTLFHYETKWRRSLGRAFTRMARDGNRLKMMREVLHSGHVYLFPNNLSETVERTS